MSMAKYLPDSRWIATAPHPRVVAALKRLAVRPVWDHLLRCFGPSRLIWGFYRLPVERAA